MRRPFPLGRRGALLFGLALLALAAALELDLGPRGLVPRAGGARIAREFLGAALTPALTHEGAVPAGAAPFLWTVVAALRRTLVFAAASMSLAMVGGAVLGFLASSAWWRAQVHAAPSRAPRTLRPLVQASARVAIALLRSVHELVFAVIFLAAFGINTAAAVLALALPFSGTLAKVFSELLDEAPADAARALQAAGASPAQAFFAGTLPRVAPDLAAYAFYRFECAVRVSAVLGFFGFETLGYGLETSFENLHYHEVWTHLYALIALVLLLESWSASLRRRFVA
jgi:phosphonate transport system permease protein